VLFIPHVGVPKIIRPKLAVPVQHFVGFTSGKFLQLLGLTVFFARMWLVSAGLFRKAAGELPGAAKPPADGLPSGFGIGRHRYLQKSKRSAFIPMHHLRLARTISVVADASGWGGNQSQPPMHAQSLQARLLAAIEAGDVAQVEALVAGGADVNSVSGDLDGATPLIRAITASRQDVVQVLIKAGADVNRAQNSSKGWTPLMFAFQQPGIMRELLTAGANVNARTPVREAVSPRTGKVVAVGREAALHIVAAAHHLECAKLLVERGAEIDGRTEDDLGPLDIALRQGSANPVAAFLIEAGAELTPRRLQLIHATAIEDSNEVWQFVWAERFQPQSSSPDSRRQAGANAPETYGGIPAASFKCPHCGALLPSRKTKMCGNCGRALPPELLAEMHRQHEQQREQRAWARNLAQAFDSRRAAAAGAAGTKPHPCDFEEEALSTTALLKGTNCAEEFRTRKRPFFWLYLAGYFFMFLAGAFGLALARGGSASWLAMLGATALMIYITWQRASPICPNCSNNIVTCIADRCHVCGKLLKARRCNSCGVSTGIGAWFFPYSQPGNIRWIKHCPSCVVLLESKVRRWYTR
jgi:ankyrin repeat protein